MENNEGTKSPGQQLRSSAICARKLCVGATLASTFRASYLPYHVDIILVLVRKTQRYVVVTPSLFQYHFVAILPMPYEHLGGLASLVTMSFRRCLSDLKGAPLSTWWRIDFRVKVRGAGQRVDLGLGLFALHTILILIPYTNKHRNGSGTYYPIHLFLWFLWPLHLWREFRQSTIW